MVNLSSGLFVMVCECLNLALSIIHYGPVESPSKYYAMYYYHFASILYATSIMYIVSRIYALSLRVDLFTEYLNLLGEKQLCRNGNGECDDFVKNKRMILEDYVKMFVDPEKVLL